MTQFFICGNSGSGKSTFCEEVSKQYPELIYVREVIRRMPSNSQLSYLLAYNDIHKLDNIISDRSILDVIVFNNYERTLLEYIKNTFKKPDVVIVTPEMSREFIEANLEIWTEDKVRFHAYHNRFGWGWSDRPSNHSIIGKLHEAFCEDRMKMIEYLKYLGWNWITHTNESNYYSWQDSAKVILENWLDKKDCSNRVVEFIIESE